MRSLWKGAINFGLVHIPVSMWKATRPQDLRFRQLHEKDLVPIKQKKVCPADNKEVSQDEIVKGYEVRKGEFVPIDDEDLEAVEPEASHSIDIEDFVTLAEVDPIYFENAYYLAPEKGAGRAYTLLVAGMKKSGMAAIVRFVMRSKQHLAIIRPFENGLEISTLYFADEVMSIDDVPGIPKQDKTTKQELDMAVKLIESMSRPFDAENYEDTYREEMLDMIKKKAKGVQPVKPEVKEPKAKVIDLVGALQQSLEGGDARPAKKKKASGGEGGSSVKKKSAAASKGKASAAKKTTKKKSVA